MVCEIVVLRKVLGLERKEATGAWRKPHNKEIPGGRKGTPK